ncbi:MAG: HdeD family acid-resistance protein [Methanomassiliicoccales archaeon]|nr:HdeD family acid-resistance protein [Methanomassiliicoccales archaeon]NYT15387.1 HdeD family acid-resistance protein [Methanomassiliicoccales archaeon]
MDETDMKQIEEQWKKRKWWEKVAVGLVALIFGILAFVLPGITLLTVTILFGSFALLLGFFSLFSGIIGKDMKQARWLFVAQGILGIIIGIIALAWPDITLLAMAYLVGAWAMIFGMFEIIAAVWTPQEAIGVFNNMSKGLLAASGLLSLIFGILIILFPGAGVLAILWIIATYAIILGVINIMLGLQQRKSAASI